MRIYATLAAAALLGFSTVAAAQQPTVQVAQPPVSECLCNLPIAAGSRVATLEDIRGQVLLADTGGYTHIQSRAELSVGDRIVLLRKGQAVLTAGTNCRVALTPGSIISVDAFEGRACIAQVSQAAAIVPMQAPPPDEDDDLLVQQETLLLAGAAAVGIGVIVFVALSDDDDDEPVSP